MEITVTPEIRSELALIVQQAMEQREQKQVVDKTVYNRICAEFEHQLHSFDYCKPRQYIDRKGVTCQYDAPIPCHYRIQEAICTLLRVTYQVDARAKLPSEREAEMREFMQNVLTLMEQLKSSAV